MQHPEQWETVWRGMTWQPPQRRLPGLRVDYPMFGFPTSVYIALSSSLLYM